MSDIEYSVLTNDVIKSFDCICTTLVPNFYPFNLLDSSHWHEFISTVEIYVEPDLVLRSHLILIYTVFTTGYI